MGAGERSGLIVALAMCGLIVAPWSRGKTADKNARQESSGGGYTLDPCCRSQRPAGFRPVELVRDSLAQQSAAQVHTVIVTVADPERTRLANLFDETLDAISTRLASAGFAQERYWLPWQPAAKPGHEGDPKPDPLTQPGLIVYRRGVQQSELLNVCLVGESPTTGAHLAALEECIALAWHFTPHEKLRIVGPSFSGSAQSLWPVLARAATETLVVTGSATADIREGLPAKVTLERTVVPDKELLDFLLDQLGTKHTPPRVALLTESGTYYGSSFEAETAASSATHANGQAGATPEQPAVHSSETRPSGDARIVQRHYFPRHIAQVRAAHEQASAQPDSGLDLRRTLKLKLDAPPSSTDTVPTFSALGQFQAELNLRDTLQALAASSVRYLIIAATDPADTMYLVREARMYCPDIQPITLDSNVLFTHPDQSDVLSGLLVASSYSGSLLMEEGQAASEMPHVQPAVKFSSATAEGTYNALTRQLIELDPKLPYAERTRGREPQPWLGVVASGRLWPLHTKATIDVSNSSMLTVWQWARPTMYARTMAVLIAVLCCVRAYRLLQMSRVGPQRASLHRSAQSVALAAYGALVAIIAPQAYDLTKVLSGRFDALPVAMLCRGLLPVASTVLITMGALEARRHLTDPWVRARRWPLRATRWLQVGLLVALSVLMVTFAISMLRELADPSRFALVWLRLRDPLALSPLSSLFFLFAGLYAWTHLGMARARCSAAFARTLPLSERLTPAWIRDLRRVGREGDPLWRAWPRSVGALAIAGFLLGAWVFWRRVLPSFEPFGFDPLHKALFVTLAGLVLLACAYLTLLWSRIHAAMAWLMATPMTAAYNRISHKITLAFGFQLSSNVPSADDLRVSVQTLEFLAEAAEQISSGTLGALIRECARDLRAIAGELREQFQSEAGQRLAATRERHIHQLFFRASRLLHATLDALWHARARDVARRDFGVALGAEVAATGGELDQVPTAALLPRAVAPAVQVWTRAAEDFVAMRVVTYVYYLLHQLRLHIRFAVLGALALLCAVFSYPWEPQRFVVTTCGTLLVIVAGLTLRCLVAMERAELLVRLGKTSTSWLNLGFLNQVLTYVVLPVALLVARLFPSIGERFATQIEPLWTLFQ